MKKIIAAITAFSLLLAVAGCTNVSVTATPGPEETQTPEETKAPQTTPTPTEELYTWTYNEYEPGKIDVSIVINEGADVREIKRVKVPNEIDGKTVTKIPHDFFGAKKDGRRVGFGTKESDYEEIECYVEYISFPNTVEIFENDLFWFGLDTLSEIYFKSTSKLVSIGARAFANTPVETEYAEDHAGRMTLNGILTYFAPAEEIRFPGEITSVAECAFHGADYSGVKSVIINDGCKKLSAGFLGDAGNVEWIYIPSSVREIGGEICGEELKKTVVIKTPRGSFAEQWAEEHGYRHENSDHGVEYAEGELFGWEYNVLEEDPETVTVAIWVPDETDRRDIIEVEVPAYVNGYRVTTVGTDLFGCRTAWYDPENGILSRKGLCQIFNPDSAPFEWTDPEVYVEKVIFPETIESFVTVSSHIAGLFWFGGMNVEEIVFKSTENIKHIGRYAFHTTMAEQYMTEDAGGYLVINGMLVNALAFEEVVFPEDVVEPIFTVFASINEDYRNVRSIRINDGCTSLGFGFTEALHELYDGPGYLCNLTDLYVPASVTYIDDGAVWYRYWSPEEHDELGFNVHVVKGSYADEWFTRTWGSAYNYRIIYDME